MSNVLIILTNDMFFMLPYHSEENSSNKKRTRSDAVDLTCSILSGTVKDFDRWFSVTTSSSDVNNDPLQAVLF